MTKVKRGKMPFFFTFPRFLGLYVGSDVSTIYVFKINNFRYSIVSFLLFPLETLDSDGFKKT